MRRIDLQVPLGFDGRVADLASTAYVGARELRRLEQWYAVHSTTVKDKEESLAAARVASLLAALAHGLDMLRNDAQLAIATATESEPIGEPPVSENDAAPAVQAALDMLNLDEADGP